MKNTISASLHKKIFIVLYFLFGLSVQIMAQSGGNMALYNQAGKLFKAEKYYEAAQLYEKFLASEKRARPASQPFAVQKKLKGKINVSPHEEAVYNLAESYRLYNDYTQAEKWYQKATKFNEKAYPACLYWYAVSLRANQKYPEAMEALTLFNNKYTGTEMLTAASKELNNLLFIQEQLKDTTGKGFIMNMQKNSRSTSAYALAYQNEDTVVFTSMQRSYTIAKNKKDTDYVYNNHLFYSADGDKIADRSVMMRLPGDSGMQNGLASFSANGNKIFFTRWNKKNGKTFSAIYTAVRTDSGWSDPELLEAPINIDGYNSAQPFITADNRYLLFASDRPGGLGKYDLWYASLDSNFNVLFADNMGNIINTPGDDECPFYHDKSHTLLFSSNSRTGMGEFDIYYANNSFDFAHWAQPLNAGAQVNSSKNDLYYISTDKENLWNTGWLSSDRESECCLELYEVKQKNSLFVTGIAVDSLTGKPLSTAKVVLNDTRHDGKMLAEIITDTAGRYHFNLHNTSAFVLHVSNDKYQPFTQKITVHFKTAEDSLFNKPVVMVPLPDSMRTKEIAGVQALLNKSSTLGKFEFKKARLNGEAFTNLDSLAALMNKYPALKVEVAGYTDGLGNEAYNIRLSQARIDICIGYLVKKGVDAGRIVGKAMGKCCPVEPDSIDGKDNPSGRAKNRRVEYTIINN